MTELHYWSLNHTITGWGLLILAMHMTSPLLLGILLVASLTCFFFDYHCGKEIKKESRLSTNKGESTNELL
jgi:hypothetical protein